MVAVFCRLPSLPAAMLGGIGFASLWDFVEMCVFEATARHCSTTLVIIVVVESDYDAIA